MAGIGSPVVLFDFLAAQTGKLVPRKDRYRLPAYVQGLLDGAVLVGPLVDKLALKGTPELKILLIDLPKLLLPDDRGERSHLHVVGVRGVQLSRQMRVISPRTIFADAAIHHA